MSVSDDNGSWDQDRWDMLLSGLAMDGRRLNAGCIIKIDLLVICMRRIAASDTALRHFFEKFVPVTACLRCKR